jgi:hypothetical protein
MSINAHLAIRHTLTLETLLRGLVFSPVQLTIYYSILPEDQLIY